MKDKPDFNTDVVLTINFGRSIGSIFAERQLAKATAGFQKSIERLSSGLRINRASDDAAGLAISSSLTAKDRIYTQAIRNTNDAISALNIADGAAQGLSGIIIRLKELAEGAANGSLSRTQRVSSDTEATALVNEYNRILGSATFNNRRLLDPANGQYNFQLGIGNAENLGVNLGSGISRNIASGTVTSQSATFDASSGGITADVNGDGKQDIIALTFSAFSVEVNRGDGSFSNTYSFDAFPATTSSVATGDFNNDGKLDIVASYGSTTRIFTGDGTGNFTPSTTVAAIAGQLAVGDFNNDGEADIAVGTSTGVNVYSGQAGVTFSSGVSTNLGQSSVSLAVGDYNGDGISDLIVGGTTKVTALVGAQSASLSQAASFSTGTSASQVLLGDLNHDGLLDIVASTSSQFKILNQQSGGTLVNSANITATINKAALVDYNGDGNLDIINGSAGYDVYRSNDDGTFQSAWNLGSGSFLNNQALLAADFNNDGVLDIISSNDDPTTEYYLSNTQKTANIARLDLTTASAARTTLTTLDTLLNNLATELGNIGATQSRLNSTLNTLSSRTENYRAANDRIVSADVAEESANLIRQQILQQSATAVLAQANQAPSLAVQLIR